MILKKLTLIALVLMLLPSLVFAGESLTAEKKFKSLYSSTSYQSFDETTMTGIYSIEAGDNVIYFHEQSGNLIVGEVWTSKGESVTSAHYRALMLNKKPKN